MSYLSVINEFSIFKIFVAAALRRKIFILDIDPLFPFSKRVLNSVVAKLVDLKMAVWAIDAIKELERVKEVPGRTLLYDVFAETEQWQNEYFQFSSLEEKIMGYGMAFKLAVTNYMSPKHVALLVIREYFRKDSPTQIRCIGLSKDLRAASEAYCNARLPGRAAFIPAFALNLIQFIMVVVLSFFWIVARVRLRKAESKSIFLAADFIADTRDFELYEELEEGGNVLMVARGLGKNSPHAEKFPNYTFCNRGIGSFTIGDFFSKMAMILKDEWKIFRHFYGLHPGLYRRFASLPYQRLMYQGLFSLYRPQYFWGRDPYNEDHIIRRQELNKIGGKSYGVNTGALTWAILIPAWRYISFDRFYVFGRGKYEKYYGETWSKSMDVVPAGSFSATREHFSRRFEKRPPDIVVFTSVFIDAPEMVPFIRGLAKAFSDRKIILQVKIQFQHLPFFEKFIHACQKNLDNVVYTSDSAYDLFFQARYGISDPSSIVLEAMQFGMISFGLDLPHIQVSNINRQYPGLTVETPEDAISRIRSLEDGTWHYPIEEFHDVVDMSGNVFFDRVRCDMGLQAKQQIVPLV